MRITDRHLTSEQVDEVATLLLGRIGAGTDRGDVLPDDAAVTIASWWQAPSGTGRHLAALASGAEVDPHPVADDTADTIAEWSTQAPGGHADHATREAHEWNGALLNLLAAWAADRVATCDCADCVAERAADADTDRWQERDWS